jgi:DNA-binding beta-propeller fold protein YncE
MARSDRTRSGRVAVAVVVLAALSAVPTLLPQAGGADPAPAVSSPTAYVANGNDGTVTPVDVSTNVAGTPIPINADADPVGVAITPDGSTAYIADQDEGVWPIATATNTLGAMITVGADPGSIAITPDGATAYVTDSNGSQNAGTVTPVATATNTVGTPITVGDGPDAVAITPDGQTAYVLNADDGTLTPIATSTNTAGTAITVAEGTEAMAMAPDGATVYVAASSGDPDVGSIVPVATATNTAGTAVPAPPFIRAMAVSPDGSTLYAVDSSGDQVTPYSLPSLTAGTPISLAGSGPTAIAITSDGTTAYVTEGGLDQVVPITLATGAVGTPIPVGSNPDAIAITPGAATPPGNPPAGPLAVTTSSLPAANVGTAYSQTLAASGGTPPYSWSLAAGSAALPAGLTLAADGTVSGTPTAAGITSVTVEVTDSSTPTSQTATASLSLTVNGPLSTVTPLSAGNVGVPYSSTTLEADGGTPPYAWFVSSGSPPAGLAVNPGTGDITGTPSSAGTSTFSVTVTDSSSPTPERATETFSITIEGSPLAVTTTSLLPATLNAPYSQTLAATGGTGPYKWALTGGSLPTGVTLDGPTGTISGTPTSVGLSTFSVTVTDSTTPTPESATASLSLAVNGQLTITVTPAGPAPTGHVGHQYQLDYQASGGVAPYTWAVTSGSLPPGTRLHVNAADGSVADVIGTPSSAGTFAGSITATDSSQPTAQTASVPFSITVLAVAPLTFTTTSLPDATGGAAYSQTIAVTGGVPPYSFDMAQLGVFAGIEPTCAGDSCSATITGIGGYPGTYPFNVNVTDGVERASEVLSLTVLPDPAAQVPGPTGYLLATSPPDAIGFQDVLTFDTATNAPIAAIPMPNPGLQAIAITPDDRTAYVADNSANGGEVFPMNLATDAVGTGIPVGPPDGFANGIAVSPSGATAYVLVTTGASSELVPIDIATDAVGAPIPLPNSENPLGSLAISADGSHVYIATATGVIVIDLASGSTVTEENSAAQGATETEATVAVAPVGDAAYLFANYGLNNFDTNEQTVGLYHVTHTSDGAAIYQDSEDCAAECTANATLAVNPSGTAAYTSTQQSPPPTGDFTEVLDEVPLDGPVPGCASTVCPLPGAAPLGPALAVTPDGSTVYAAGPDAGAGPEGNPLGSDTAVAVNPATGAETDVFAPGCCTDMAIAPDQAPTAAFTITPQPDVVLQPPSQPPTLPEGTRFDASSSVDVSSPITSYAWNFGDGQSAITTTPTTSHVYGHNATFTVTLTETDEAGTSLPASTAFTGRTMSRHGGLQAQISEQLTIGAPVLPPGAGLGPGGGGTPTRGVMGGPGVRMGGPDGVGSSVIISQEEFQGVGAGAAAAGRVRFAAAASGPPALRIAHAAVIASVVSYPDGLVAGPLAVARDGPLLLNPTGSLDPRVQAEIQRILEPGSTVYLMGGRDALAPGIASTLSTLGYTVVRYGGADRFATAVAVAQALGNPPNLFVATGTDFPDALSAGAAAAANDGAVLLTAGSAVPPATAAYLASAPGATVYAIGGPAASALPAATPVTGSDRYATAVAVADRFFPAPPAIGLASGLSFADALAGGPQIAALGGPILLTDPDTLSPATLAYVQANAGNVTYSFVYGGPAAVSDAVQAAFIAALGGS